MLDDVVVDTNVILHSRNPNERRFVDSVRFIEMLLNGAVKLCIDEGFHPEEFQNQSLIGGEYLDQMHPGSPSYAVIVELANSGRIKIVAKRVPPAVGKRILRCVPRNPRDRTFVKVAFNSQEHVLVSHDYEDFGTATRERILTTIGVDIVEAFVCCSRLHPE
ncbi:MAG TPA: hypothetical protein VI756_04905 [Blastocatellia bacterium]